MLFFVGCRRYAVLSVSTPSVLPTTGQNSGCLFLKQMSSRRCGLPHIKTLSAGLRRESRRTLMVLAMIGSEKNKGRATAWKRFPSAENFGKAVYRVVLVPDQGFIDVCDYAAKNDRRRFRETKNEQ